MLYEVITVKMKETGAQLACEVSGHIFFKHRYFGYDDAIYATLRMLELIAEGIDLDKEIDALPQVFSTEEIKVETTEEEKFAIIEKVKELLQNPPVITSYSIHYTKLYDPDLGVNSQARSGRW